RFSRDWSSDVCSSDLARDPERALAVGAGVAVDHVANVRGHRQRDVALPVHAGKMQVLLVAAADEIGDRERGMIGDHAHALFGEEIGRAAWRESVCIWE